MIQRVSIKDVAKLAGTSIATVSRTLNAADHPVSEELRSRVLQASLALRYRPNRMAQNLRKKQTTAIGLLVRDIGDTYFSGIAKGVTHEAEMRGLMPLVCSSRRDHGLEIEFMHLLAQHQVAGIILTGSGCRNKEFSSKMFDTVREIQGMGIRVVACAHQDIPMPQVLVDNFVIGRAAFSKLYSLGHRDFAVISGEGDNASTNMRIDGFVEAAHEAGVALEHEKDVYYGDFSWAHGRAAACRILEKRPRASAIFCTNDNIAIGVIRGLREMGCNPPEDMSVIGVGDIAMAPYTHPSLSTFHIPLGELGATALMLIFDPKADNDTRIFLDSSYMGRESVTRAK
ncbi:MAG: LacI family transcriptional regulator [Deltaproteobacteria bacterium]|jgi:DNA-binding LacI/PurR family transcriptional regulator|nr:LacI family transcriptional regulator [Deltaproteobacteria bacterium]